MKKLFEAVSNLEVTNGTGKAYRKAFEQENERYLTKRTLRNGNSHVAKDKLELIWSDSYCHVGILHSIPVRKSKLIISIVSRTLRNVEDAVTDHQVLGAGLVHKSWE